MFVNLREEMSAFSFWKNGEWRRGRTYNKRNSKYKEIGCGFQRQGCSCKSTDDAGY